METVSVPAPVAALTAAVRRRTVAGPGKDPAEFDGLHADLRAHFPHAFAACETTDLGDHALLLRWPGRDPQTDAVVLLAHQDVVPAGPEEAWTHPPYAGSVVDGAIWGRGTIDDKGSLVGILAAVDRLVAAGHRPTRDIWLSFGSDEEVMGVTGRRAVAELQGRGVTPWFVLDEGGAIVSDALPGVSARMAMIGLSEKGNAAIDLAASGSGGHASQPPRHGAVARLARALVRIEDSPAPPRMTEPVAKMITALGGHLPGPARLLTDRADRLGLPMARLLSLLGPELAALTRTTIALTELRAAPANNVLPTTATAGLNVRIAVGETRDDVLARLRRTINDRQVTVTLRHGDDPSPVSPTDAAYDALVATLHRCEPDTGAIPYLVMAATDSRHFHRIWPRVYRFAPFHVTKAQRQSIHNVDEHLGVTDFLAGVDYYADLLEHL
ncbi:MAG: M20/M25/M40 family metallo-hydrolase [Austwickia sp.]|jgi:carboxypeptidase PM20D1|nr:MAG: M20/M25/M40 family metallo-hydrolase [Austwickia sp.]